MLNKTKQIIPLTKEGPGAVRLIIKLKRYNENWIDFELQQLQNDKWIPQQLSYCFQAKYVENILEGLTQVLEGTK